MKINTSTRVLAVLTLSCAVFVAFGASPFRVTVSVRGSKYDIEAATVSELKSLVSSKAGISEAQQAVLYKGKVLSNDDDLEAAGVKSGDVINVVPQRKSAASAAPKMTPSSEIDAAVDGLGLGGVSSPLGGLPSGAGDGGGDPFGGLGEALGGLGGGLGGGDMSQMAGMYKQMMDEMMNSDVMEQYLNDDSKIEASRQMILENEELKKAITALPGMAELINDPEKWREQMVMARDMLLAQKKMFQQAKGKDGAGAAPGTDGAGGGGGGLGGFPFE